MITPEERRGALTLLAIILLGALWDASGWSRRPSPIEPVEAESPFAGIAPVAGPTSESTDSAAASPGRPAAPAAPLDLNRATAAELDALPGIGPVLARRILEHRARIGRFGSVEELREVRGVGPRLLERIRPRVRAGPGR